MIWVATRKVSMAKVPLVRHFFCSEADQPSASISYSYRLVGMLSTGGVFSDKILNSGPISDRRRPLHARRPVVFKPLKLFGVQSSTVASFSRLPSENRLKRKI